MTDSPRLSISAMSNDGSNVSTQLLYSSSKQRNEEVGLFAVRKKAPTVHHCYHFQRFQFCPFKGSCHFLHTEKHVGERNRALKLEQVVSEEYCTPIRKENESTCDKVSVDNYYYIRSSELSCGTPLGFSVDDPEKAIQRMVGGDQELDIPHQTRILRLQVALVTRGEFEEKQFMFWPTHILHQSGQSHACMVIQQKAFSVQDKNALVEISLADYKNAVRHQKNRMLLLVHELAFGPAFKRGVTPPCLFFQLSEDDLVVCPPESAKRYVDSLRLKGCAQPVFPTALKREHPSGTLLEQSFPGLHYPFYHVKPNDKDAFNLVSRVMHFQLCTLHMEEEVGEVIDEVEQYGKKAIQAIRELALKSEYQKFVHYCNKFVKVPRTKGLKVPTHMNESVPGNSCNYVVEDDGCDSLNVAKRYNKAIFDLQRIREDSSEDVKCVDNRRLPVFRQLFDDR